ncbi:hypothetical protein POJ06DRAFT_240146 [Lipomyces tetrasporus]|uniref:Uncharacterized protein n=1 Tax=Lipomyces tetrasporus TaxID=54092 RepID=A0AAD7QNH9_9ASCO|nr:uncharacterized protein POJ06DRAFT_240146 [Lipomyces tetrasporus]KAJ8098444.1 hypothetical protein POJ06DRAFT_240146 [Lipomyces tetrasporus]
MSDNSTGTTMFDDTIEISSQTVNTPTMSWAHEMEIKSENQVQKAIMSDIPVKKELEVFTSVKELQVDKSVKSGTKIYDLEDFQHFNRVLEDSVGDTYNSESTYCLVDFLQFMTVLDSCGGQDELVDIAQCPTPLDELSDTDGFVIVTPIVPTVKAGCAALENQKVTELVGEGESSSNSADSLDSDAESDCTPLKTDGLPELSTTADLDHLSHKFLLLSTARHAVKGTKDPPVDKTPTVQASIAHDFHAKAVHKVNSCHSSTQTGEDPCSSHFAYGTSSDVSEYAVGHISPTIRHICASLNNLALELQDIKRTVAILQSTKPVGQKDKRGIEKDKPVSDLSDEPSEELDSVQLTLYNFRRAINEIKIDIQCVRNSINVVDSNAVAREFNTQLKNGFTGTGKDNLCILRRWDGECPPIYPKTMLDAKRLKYDEIVAMLGFYGFEIGIEQEDELDMKRKLLAFLGCPVH